MNPELAFRLFERWLNDERLSANETNYLILCAILYALTIVIIVEFFICVYVWPYHIYYFFEDIWLWIKSVYRKMFNIKEDFSEEE